MKENFQMLARWWNFTRPNKGYFFLSFMSGMLFRICFYMIQPIFAAKVITSLTAGDYQNAIFNLALGTLVFVVAYCIHHVKYLMHDKLLRSTYLPFQQMISSKIFLAEDINFKNNSKDKLLNISYQDAWDTANFSDTLTTRIGQLGQALITFIIIAATNIYVALIILVMILINSFILSFLQTKYAKGTRKIREGVDGTYHSMTAMLDSRTYVFSAAEQKRLQENHMAVNKSMLDEFRKRQTWSSANDNGYGIWCKIFIFVVTLLTIILVEKNALSLEMYFIIVPYITTMIDSSNEVLATFRDLKNSVVAMNRLQVISNFTERDIVRFGNNSVDDILGQIDFIDIDYQPKNTKTNTLNDINFHVRENETSIIFGEKDCGKRSIFELLMRRANPNVGQIYIDGMRAEDYTNKSYFKNITYTTSKPYFASETILPVLTAVTKAKDKINKTCMQTEIYETIANLPNGFDSQTSDLNATDRFLLDLSRCLLTGANIIAIYELPSIDEKNKEKIIRVLQSIKGTRTLIIFSGQEEYKEICDKIVEIEKGEVKNIQFNINK